MSNLPKLSCLCPTFRRPKLLANAIACFETQDYPLELRELIVLDDAGHFPTEPSGPGWHIVSVDERFETLSEKRNRLEEMASRDADTVVIWDDDDVHLPWTLAAHADALKQRPVSHPRHVFYERQPGVLAVKSTGQLGYQATQAIDRKLFRKVGGYPFGNSGVDQQLIGLLKEQTTFADPLERWPIFYIYRWGTTGQPHLSSIDRETGYKRMLELTKNGYEQSDLKPALSSDWHAIALETMSIPASTATRDMPAIWQTTRERVLSIQ